MVSGGGGGDRGCGERSLPADAEPSALDAETGVQGAAGRTGRQPRVPMLKTSWGGRGGSPPPPGAATPPGVSLEVEEVISWKIYLVLVNESETWTGSSSSHSQPFPVN